MRRTKIVCTLGPATDSEEAITRLVLAGMNVARLNFSHGDHAYHRALFARVRAVSASVGVPIAVLQDLQGPKLRVGVFDGGSALLRAGQTFRLWTEPMVGNTEGAYVNWPRLSEEVRRGDVLLLDDGLLRLRVTDHVPTHVTTEVEIGGTLRDRKGINVPSSALSVPSLTEKDREDLRLGLELGVDYVALSFVRSPLDVHQLRALIPDGSYRPGVIAKIEKPQAARNLDAILDASDGIMLARGDLGVELPPEQVPVIQKEALRKANMRGKPCIIATQMLESMTSAPRPTRAEASDVANAIFDGADAVMLSAETASGHYPFEAVEMMSRIATTAEASMEQPSEPRRLLMPKAGISFPLAIARSAAVAAEDLKVRVIACFTVSGRTPRLIMAHRPQREILAFTPDETTYRKMALFWGVRPLLCALRADTDGLIALVEEELRQRSLAQRGDPVLIVMGIPASTRTPTNMIKFHTMS